jgi:diacylglycerol O-acyltransferase / wax synthase
MAMASSALIPDRLPRRVLVVSADIGGGHHATGRALAERVQQRWPGSVVRWVDTLDAMGRWVGPAFRRTYVTNVEVTPWLYEFFYASLWRHRWFADASKRFVGSWAGRRLTPVIDEFDPDLIVSTYPLGSAGLAWLLERRGLDVPAGAWVSDFAPHPFWVYPQLPLTLVVHPAALPLAHAAAPGATVAVCAPPVVTAFGPGDRHGARLRFGLDPDRAVALVACGSLGFGAVVEAVRALLAVGDQVRVVVVCGRNAALARRLTALDEPVDRLLVLGWVDDMPTLLRASDLVVTNAGGATALEAVATGTPVVMYRPIAAHGAANAALMTVAGVAELCWTPPALTAYVRSRLARPVVPPATDQVCLPDLGLPALAERPPSALPPRRRRSWRMRPHDAFFRHVESAAVPQEIGAVIDLDRRPDGRPVGYRDLAGLLTQRLSTITMLRRRPVPRGRLREPGWVIDRTVDISAHLAEHRIQDAGDSADAVIERFWSLPLPAGRPPWRMLLVTGLPENRVQLAVKLHHSLGDGLSVIGTLQRLLDPPRHAATTRSAPLGPIPQAPRPPAAAGFVARVGAGVRRSASLASGLGQLAVAGRAPLTMLNGPVTTRRRRLATTTLPADEVSRLARACAAHPAELVNALVAAALREIHPGDDVPERVRAMFPVSRRSRPGPYTFGNWTGAIALDLPLGPMSATERVTAVRDALRLRLAGGQPAAAALVMRAMGALPAPVHAGLARLVYSSRFVNVIVSYLAGAKRPTALAGAPIRSVIPVVALADGVRVGVGALRWGQTTGIGVLLDPAIADQAETFIRALHTAFDELRAATSVRATAVLR